MVDASSVETYKHAPEFFIGAVYARIDFTDSGAGA